MVPSKIGWASTAWKTKETLPPQAWHQQGSTQKSSGDLDDAAAPPDE
jgi:hypothetical protein